VRILPRRRTLKAVTLAPVGAVEEAFVSECASEPLSLGPDARI
jgi:hypothetical protein